MRNRKHTEQKILESATRLFSRHGLHGVSVRAIASDADVNLSLISQYFGGKAPLYDRCMETLYESLGDAVAILLSSMEGETRPGQVIRHAIANAIRLGHSNRESVLLTMRDFVERGQMDEVRRDSLLVPTIHNISSHLASYSTLDAKALNMAIFGVILLLGRFIAFSNEDIEGVITMSTMDGAVLDSLTDLALRMLGLPNETKFAATHAQGA